MKKIISLFITIILCVSNAYAESNYDYYTGTWLFSMELNDNYYSVELFHFFKDGTGYYFNRIIENNQLDENPIDLLITWKESENGIQVKFPLYIHNYYLMNDGRLSDGAKALPQYFVKVYPVDQKSADAPKIVPGNLQDGYLLYPGQYIIGEDIPAGDYRFEYYDAPTDIFVRKDPESALWNSFASVTNNSPVYAKLNLPDGGRIDIGAFPVIIMKSKPLNIGD